jgi:uncharacterized protein HemY
MAKRALTNAEIDSHKVTMALHLSTAERLIKNADFGAAKVALELAWPHANAIGNKEIKSRVFAALNSVRAAIKRTNATASKLPPVEFVNHT